MILCTVGTHDQGFNRLVKPMDELASQLEERVVIQHGSSPYSPRFADNFSFTTHQHMEQLTREANVVVSHAAAGAIILTLKLGKPIVLIPRLHKYKEHYDDHQLELATALKADGRAVIVAHPTVASLRMAIKQAKRQVSVTENPSPSPLVQALRTQINHIDNILDISKLRFKL